MATDFAIKVVVNGSQLFTLETKTVFKIVNAILTYGTNITQLRMLRTENTIYVMNFFIIFKC